MQDVTDLRFWSLIIGTEARTSTNHFRVPVDSTTEKPMLDSITRNTTGRPVIAPLMATTWRRSVRTAAGSSSFPLPRSI